jgi:hypothetical protein
MAGNVDEFFEHVGVMGMRWGKRGGKTTTTTTRTTTTTSLHAPSSDHQVAQGLKKKKLQSMSNDEIKTLNSRLQLEIAYKSLTKSATTLSKGESFVKKTLALAATAQGVYALANSPMIKAAEKVISSGGGKHVKK